MRQKRKNNIYNVKILNGIYYAIIVLTLPLFEIFSTLWVILYFSFFLASVAIAYTRVCPLSIIARFGFMKFLKTSKHTYKKKFIPAMVIYGLYPVAFIIGFIVKYL